MTSSHSHPVENFVEMLLRKWSTEEELYRRRGQTELAALMASIAEEVESESERYLDEPLTLAESAEIGGYGYSTLQALVRAGRIPDAGERGRPRVRRRDLPRRPSGIVSAGDVRSNLEKTNQRDSVDDLIESELLAREMES